MRTRSWIRCSLLSLSLALAPVHGHTAPDPQTQQARQLFEAGSLAYDQGLYLEALRAFEQAYLILPRPAVAFSAAQAQRRQYFVDRDIQRLHRAIELFSDYLEQVPQGRRRADAVEQLQELAVLVSRIDPQLPTVGPTVDPTGDPTVDPTARPTVDPATAAAPPGARPSPTVAPSPTELMIYANVPEAEASIDDGPFELAPVFRSTTPGVHHVVVRAAGHRPYTATRRAIQGRIVPVEAELIALPATLSLSTRAGARILVDGRELGFAPLVQPITLDAGPHELSVTQPGRETLAAALVLAPGDDRTIDAPLPPTPRRRAIWGLAGASGGLTIGAAITLGLALGQQRQAAALDDLRGERNISGRELDRLNTSLDRRDALRGATVGLASAAVVGGVVALVLLLSDEHRTKNRRRD